MKTADSTQSLEFSLEGQFIGFVGCPKAWKSLRLKLQTTDIQIKLPKHLRQSLLGFLQPEQPLRVMGIGKLDPNTQQLKFKATQVTLLSRFEPTIAPVLTCPITTPITTPIASPIGSPMAAVSSPTQASLPRVKVRVCQKSGCLKKGGKGIAEALAKVLADHELAEYVTIERMGCVKRCSSAPNVAVGKDIYSGVRPHRLSKVSQAIVQRLGKTGHHCSLGM